MTARRRALGRGLDSLLPRADSDVRRLPIDALAPNPRQPRRRFDSGALDDLAGSIRSQGVVQPIVVSPDGAGGYAIVAGERRWRAARRAGLEEVPVVVREVEDERELLELALVENLQRTDLDPLEEAEAYAALRDEFELSQGAIAERVGKARSTVANSLRLLELAEPVRDLLASRELTAGQVRPLVGLPEPRQVEIAERAAAEDLSSRDVERLARAEKSDGRSRPGGGGGTRTDVHHEAAAEELTRKLKTRVRIERRGAGGEVRIEFHSEEELMRLYDLLIAIRGGA